MGCDRNDVPKAAAHENAKDEQQNSKAHKDQWTAFAFNLGFRFIWKPTP